MDDSEVCNGHDGKLVIRAKYFKYIIIYNYHQEDECALLDETKSLMLPPQGVVLVWDWIWDDEGDDIDHVSESSISDNEAVDHYNPDMHSDESDCGEGDPDLTQTHTITFKCIGTTHHSDAQDTLRLAEQLIKEERNVPVKLEPEPDNQYDARAIAFLCFVNDKWCRIGYVVKEALDDVHSAMKHNRIMNVALAWVKYMALWQRSGLGYYAGINIIVKGKWSVVVCRCASTR